MRLPVWRLILANLPTGPPGATSRELAGVLKAPQATLTTALARLFARRAVRRSGPGRHGEYAYWLPPPRIEVSGLPQAQVQAEHR